MTVDEARSRLKDAGLRCTSCRVAVLQNLSTRPTPASHSEIAEDLVPAGFDKTTVYRCLVEIAEAGLAVRLDLGDHVWRFEMLSNEADAHAEHPHFMCIDCGKVECMPTLNVKISPTKSPRKKLYADITEVILKGHCLNCA